eukprot:4460257-Pyramimonas_sp.AAC.1
MVMAGFPGYSRSFSGEQSPLDLEAALQLVYLLFTTDVTPVPEKLKVLIRSNPSNQGVRVREPNTLMNKP